LPIRVVVAKRLAAVKPAGLLRLPNPPRLLPRRKKLDRLL
jgi:hypothetical protein